MFKMTNKEKILLGTSILGMGGWLITGYFCIAYKQACDILIEERDASYEKPFMGFVCAKPEEKGEKKDV